MKALFGVMTSRGAAIVALLLAGLAACQGVELGVGAKPAAPEPDAAVVRQLDAARGEISAARVRAQEAEQVATEAETARASAATALAALERQVADGLATQEALERARQRAVESAAEATQARDRADRARAWTDDFAARVAAASERLASAEQAWRAAEGSRLDIEGPKDNTPWGLLSWAISTGLLLVLNEKRKREAKAVLDEAMRESREAVARQDDAPFEGTAGRIEPEARLTDAPSRIDALEAALRAAGVLKGA